MSSYAIWNNYIPCNESNQPASQMKEKYLQAQSFHVILVIKGSTGRMTRRPINWRENTKLFWTQVWLPNSARHTQPKRCFQSSSQQCNTTSEAASLFQKKSRLFMVLHIRSDTIFQREEEVQTVRQQHQLLLLLWVSAMLSCLRHCLFHALEHRYASSTRATPCFQWDTCLQVGSHTLHWLCSLILCKTLLLYTHQNVTQGHTACVDIRNVQHPL